MSKCIFVHLEDMGIQFPLEINSSGQYKLIYNGRVGWYTPTKRLGIFSDGETPLNITFHTKYGDDKITHYLAYNQSKSIVEVEAYLNKMMKDLGKVIDS